jgi:hypothetical protein
MVRAIAVRLVAGSARRGGVIDGRGHGIHPRACRGQPLFSSAA